MLNTHELLEHAFENVADVRPERIAVYDYRVRLPVFEGPVDLLLHLIRKEQINIYDIPVAQICQSYLEYLNWMSQPDVNLAGEFFVMAATLTLLKSQVLLPRDESSLSEEDPRLPLVEMLLEYERFKKAAAALDASPWLLRDKFPRPATSLQENIPLEALADAPVENVDTFELLMCLKIASDRTTRKPLEIQTDTVSIRQKVVSLMSCFEGHELVEFRSLLPEGYGRKDVIVTFLACLELARLQFLEILQFETFGPIQLKAVKPLEQLNMGLLDQY